MKKTIALTMLLSTAGSVFLYFFNMWISQTQRVAVTMSAIYFFAVWIAVYLIIRKVKGQDHG